MDACSNSVDAKIDELTVLNCMDVFIASVDHCRKKSEFRISQSLSQGSPVKKTPAVFVQTNSEPVMDLQEPLIFLYFWE